MIECAVRPERPGFHTLTTLLCIGVGDRPLHTPLSTRPHSRAQLTCVRLKPPQIQASVNDELSIEGGQIWTPIWSAPLRVDR
jgi:hypothetical protein